MLKNDFLLVFPEIVLSIFAILVLMIGVFFSKKRALKFCFGFLQFLWVW